MIARLCIARAPVLVLGETGVGKELVARSLHASSPWHDRPFVAIDCGALPTAIVESELFGYERGAFTGASQRRTGLLVAAGGGAVFLDEISNLPLEAQAKLLRVLEEREVRAIGGNRVVPFHARVVAASNKDLEEAVKLGQFRKDLFYRLNAVGIEVPPLRARIEDIPALVAHFISQETLATRKVSSVAPQALDHLGRYYWPGNVRELKNCILRALALGSGSEIEVSDLPKNIIENAGSSLEPASSFNLRDLEKNAILAALRAADGNRVKAARLLGIGKTTIYRKLQEYAPWHG